MKLSASAALLLITAVSAHDTARHARLGKRQAPAASASTSSVAPVAAPSSSAPAAAASAVPALSSSGVPAVPGVLSSVAPAGVPTLIPGTDVQPLASITSGMGTQTTLPVTQTYTPGATPPVSGAPGLPTAFVYSPNDWPLSDKLPPTDSDEVTEWLKELDGWDIPDIAPTVDGTCAGSPASVAGAADNGWWTCGAHTRVTDIVACPNKSTWGMSFDDGPGQYTQNLLQYLDQEKLLATFFVVGSRVIERPAVVLEEYMSGHEISVHTWSHPHLTTLTNEQVVAELGWTRKAIQTVLGVTPTTMRPPYGDIDDRVRAISLAMGMVPIIWTSSPSGPFDTNDWKVAGGLVTGNQSFATFQGILGNSTVIDTGFIVLEHDLFEITVDLARGYFLPAAQSFQPQLTLQPIGTCQGWPVTDLYLETTTNKTFPYQNSTSSSSTAGGVPGTTGSRSGASAAQGKGDASQAQNGAVAAGVPGGLALVVTLAMALVGGAAAL